MTTGPTILVIDDEKAIRRMLRLALEGNGYTVREALTAAEGLQNAVYPLPDLILLDLVLPDRPGLEVLRRIREFSRVPIIVLSAIGSDHEKIRLLDAGTDDYLTKPFSMGELLARIRVALRHANDPGPRMELTIGSIEIDPAERGVKVGGATVHLTPTEYALLLLFMEYRGRTLTREQILAQIWGGIANELNSLRVHIAQLRKKLKIGENDPGPVRLVTLPGVGYRLEGEQAGVRPGRE